MKKHIILLSAAGLLFSSCGVYTKYKPATEVPGGLYGEEIADKSIVSRANKIIERDWKKT